MKCVDPSRCDWKLTPSSVILQSLARLKIWKPPLSVKMAPGHPVKRCSPPISSTTLYPGRKYRWYALLRSNRKPSCSKSCGSMPLTGPSVPTGMNVGVSIWPCVVASVPALALVCRSVCTTEKSTMYSRAELHLIRCRNPKNRESVLNDLLDPLHQCQSCSGSFRTQRLPLRPLVDCDPGRRLLEDFLVRCRRQNPMFVVKRVQEPGELLQIVRHAVRLMPDGAAFENRRIGGEFSDQS